MALDASFGAIVRCRSFLSAMEAPIQTKRDLLQRLRALIPELRGFGVDRLGLFGSFVRDDATDGSDVDLLVEFAPGQKTFDNFMHVSFRLEEVLGRRVELVTKESLSPYIGPHILADAEYVSVND